jgi:hypothetical protein
MIKQTVKEDDLVGKVGYLAAMSEPDIWQCWVCKGWEEFCLWKHRSHDVLSKNNTIWRKTIESEVAQDRIAELEQIVEELKQLLKDEMSRASRARYALEIASGFFDNSCVDDIRKMIRKALEETKPT